MPIAILQRLSPDEVGGGAGVPVRQPTGIVHIKTIHLVCFASDRLEVGDTGGDLDPRGKGRGTVRDSKRQPGHADNGNARTNICQLRAAKRASKVVQPHTWKTRPGCPRRRAALIVTVAELAKTAKVFAHRSGASIAQPVIKERMVVRDKCIVRRGRGDVGAGLIRARIWRGPEDG